MTSEERLTFTWAQKRKALARQLAPHRATIVGLSIAGVFSAIANGVIPYITGKFFDALVAPHAINLPLIGLLPMWAALLLLWIIAQSIANGISWVIDLQSRYLTTRMEADVQSQAFTHLLLLPTAFHKTHRTGEVTNIISRSGWMLGALTGTMVSIAPQFLTLLIGVGISFFIRPSLAFVLLAGVALYLIILLRTLPKTAHFQEEGFRVWNQAYGDGADAYANAQTVKQAGAEDYEGRRIHDAFYVKALPLWYRMERAWSYLNSSQRIIVTLTQGTVLLYSAMLVLNHSITIGDLIAFNAYAGMIIGPFVSLGTNWQTIQNGLTILARAELIFGERPEVYQPEHAVALHNLEGRITFDHVRFSYGPDQSEVLKDVSFSTKAGDVIAVVGETGAGKSTTAELISGYYFPTAGSVRIDDHDIRSLDLKILRSQIAVVPQEVVLFNASIADNIRYGRPDASDDHVRDAAKKAHADLFIESFPKAYDQEVGERGVKLSVGQKQRVAIARAMLRNPRILILDEPTSALDAETEKYITESLEELMRGRTTLIIAHRLSTVRKADAILVIKDGIVAEQGRHDELVAIEDGIYHRLYELHIGLHE